MLFSGTAEVTTWLIFEIKNCVGFSKRYAVIFRNPGRFCGEFCSGVAGFSLGFRSTFSPQKCSFLLQQCSRSWG